ncbi:mechanosensitive ion channel domain-containing protein [Psychromarinibacter sp. S121]|uniref:mechanosensitive ion channel domain-containing protein n=1 Tax=Psychromarinibacter sp. S121 TaxID=3415127 RepID=UPI003C79A5CF
MRLSLVRFLTTLLLSLSLFPLLPALAQETAADPAAETAETAPSSVDLLIEVLEDDAQRAELLEKLRAAEEDTATTSDAIVETLETAAEPEPTDLSFGRRIALVTQEVAEGIAGQLSAVWAQLTNGPGVFDGLSGNETSVLLDALKELALVIIGTVLVYVVLRRLAKRIYARMGGRARDSGWMRTVGLFAASSLMDALIVVVAWAAGYALAVLALGDFGTIGIRQTLYLNAFLLVELAKVGLRMILSPSSGDLRILPVTDRAARYMSRRLGLIIGVIGYGMLLVVPIINVNVSFAAGRAVSALIAFAVLAFAVFLVIRNRRSVAEWMLGDKTRLADAPDAEPVEVHPEIEAETNAMGPRRMRGPLAYLARNWHWPALAYLLVLFFIVLARPGEAAFQALLGSGQVAVIALLGLLLSGVLTRIMVRGVQVPEGLSARLPLLETRLNRFVPKLLYVLRLVIFVSVVLLALNAISLIDLRGWMISQFGIRATSTVFSVAMVLLGSFLVWLALTSWVDYRLNPEFGQVANARERTLLTLLRNAATIALIIVTLMFVLSELGLDIAPLLASAGVLGLAIGFGAQKMVQDIITGIFIQLENAMNVGDVVTVGGTTGSVERLTIRSASLRDVQGVYHIIPFSSVDMVSNYVKDFGYYVCDMGIAYREDTEEAKQAMIDAFEVLQSDPEQAEAIIGEFEYFGVNSLGDSAVVLRARIKCAPGKQWGVGRAYNGIVKRIFDERGIEIPFPQQTIWLGEAKNGTTQTLKVDNSAKAPRALPEPEAPVSDGEVAEPRKDMPMDEDDT